MYRTTLGYEMREIFMIIGKVYGLFNDMSPHYRFLGRGFSWCVFSEPPISARTRHVLASFLIVLK